MERYSLERHRLFLWRRRKLTVAFGVLLLGYIQSRCPNHSVWIKHWIARRQVHGAHNNLFLELQLEDPMKYRRCLRMNHDLFEGLVMKVTPFIQKQDTQLRKCIPPAERLSITLRHLATGESQESLSLLFRVGQSTISGIIRETCHAIYSVLKDDFLRIPASQEEWKCVASDFGERWNFFQCIGAMDGKHILFDPPTKSGSLFYNYKNTFSIVLLALVDAQLRFIFIDVGTNGRIGGSGVWNKCDLKQYLERNKIPPTPLPESQDLFPYVVVGDEGFPLSEEVLIPYPKDSIRGVVDRRIFNYRLSRARRCSENAFGVMANRFQIFRSAMRYDPEVASSIVLAICCLHNMLRSDAIGRSMYTPANYVDNEDVYAGRVNLGEWREGAAGLVRLGNQGGNRHARAALVLRDRWCEYFNGPGAVPWQNRMVALPQ